MKPFLFHRFQVLLLSLLICFQALGWQLLWQMKQLEVYRAASHAMMDSNNLISDQVIDLATFHSARIGSREIKLNGHLYDIESKQIKGDSVYLTLYRDDPEAYLFSILFSDHVAGSKANTPLAVRVLVQCVSSIYVLPEPLLSCFEGVNTWFESPIFHYEGTHSSVILSIGSPPPK